jgi:hypothetical protein
VNEKIKKVWFKLFVREVKKREESKVNRVYSCKKLYMVCEEIKRKFKVISLNKIIESLKIIEHEEINSEKKLIEMKKSEDEMEKIKALINERKKLRGMKNELEIFSSDTNKTRYGIRRDLNVYRNKIKD